MCVCITQLRWCEVSYTTNGVSAVAAMVLMRWFLQWYLPHRQHQYICSCYCLCCCDSVIVIATTNSPTHEATVSHCYSWMPLQLFCTFALCLPLQLWGWFCGLVAASVADCSTRHFLRCGCFAYWQWQVWRAFFIILKFSARIQLISFLTVIVSGS